MLAVALAGLSLAGCATVNGAQSAPTAFKPSNALVSYDTALIAYSLPDNDSSLRGGRSRKDYRDYVIALYQTDIENRYQRFKDQLNAADRGSALAGDLVLLGLTGATALAGAGAIDELATITAVATGTRAAIDKRLFFDRTMPAVIAAMDARRATIKAEIATRRQLPAEQYGLDAALDDLGRLKAAGNITDAVTHITAEATADKAAAEARLAAITEGCSEATPETAALNSEFMTLLTKDAAQRAARIDVAARLLEIKVPEGKAVTTIDIADAFDRKYCGDAGKRAFIDLFAQSISTQ